MTADQLAALRTPAGRAALDTATALIRAGADPLTASSALRRHDIPAPLATAALTQAALRVRAEPKFGPDAAVMFFTRTGLEQATRAVVADRRAARLAAGGASTLVDLGCGVGSDSIATARAGLQVTAVESDPDTAAVAAANLVALGLTARARVVCADATQFDLRGFDAVFCDPARRSATGRRTFDPASFSPPWSFVVDLPRRVRHAVLKLAPGLDHSLIPAGAEAEWVSVSGALVEATLWFGPLAETPRRATLLAAGHQAAELTGDGTRRAPVGPLRRYLYDPDPAVVRAGLVAEFAATIAGNLADPEIAYVYAEAAHRSRYGRCLEVLEALPFSLKRLRAAVRAAGAGRLEIMKRGSPLEPEWLRRQLRCTGDRPLTVVLTRVANAPTALLCQPTS